MRPGLIAVLAVVAATSAAAAEWQAQIVKTPARVDAIETVGNAVDVEAGGLWYRLSVDAHGPTLRFLDEAPTFERPEDALPDSRVATGSGDIARAWLADPTDRYDHGILGDKLEAGALVIERRDGTHQTLKLGPDAVFEDLSPRIADLDGDGRDEIVLVKSSLRLGSSLAVIALRRNRYEIAAETPALGAPHRWLNPAGIADFLGSGGKQIALVRQPHVVGMLELWEYDGKHLRQLATLGDASDHVAGTRAIHMAAIGDFDGDGAADVAVPSLDRTRLRIIGFKPQVHEIATIPLPAKAIINAAVVTTADVPAIALGLSDGSLVIVRR